MESIGAALKTQRENRGLSLEDAHESTKITVQNIAALESDRFDSFPNKVYARAFLRDYANFLGLNSTELLSQYEEQWSPKPEPQPVPRRSPRSLWRAFGYTILVLVILGGLGAVGYVGWTTLHRQHRLQSNGNRIKTAVATIPKAPEVAPPKPSSVVKPASTAPAAAPAAPKIQTLEVAAIRPVWVRIVADGKTQIFSPLPKGQTKMAQGKTIEIRVGMAGAVQLKLNGQLQPALKAPNPASPAEITFTMPAAATPAPPPVH